MREDFCRRSLPLLLAACLLLSCAACASAEAASIHLSRAEGTVNVSDETGKEVKVRENLGLYSGYRAETWEDGFAWVALDEGKLVKMDQSSSLEIHKGDQGLEITVKAGALFFRDAGPSDGEGTMNIRASSMSADVRGACGWIEVPDGEHMNVCILEGTAACTVEEPSGRTASASAAPGETVSLQREGAAVTLGTFREEDVPGFVLSELEEDEALCGRIREASGLDILNWDPAAGLTAGLESIGYHGDPAACRMTPEQRSAYAQVLREEIEKAESSFTPYYDTYILSSRPLCLAGLADAGGGVPLLLFGSAVEVTSQFGTELWYGSGGTVWGIWEYVDGQALRREDLDRTKVYAGHLYVGGSYVADPGLSAQVYPLENGRIASAPSTSAREDWTWDAGYNEIVTSTIDGQPAAREQMEAWTARWDPGDSLAGFSHGSDVAVDFWGLAPAQDVLTVLEGGVPASQAGPVRERAVSTYDPGTGIRRTALDPAGDPVEIYFEVPVFQEESGGYQAINAFFQEKQDAFFAGDFEEMRRMSREENFYGEPYYDFWEAEVLTRTEKLVCVRMAHQGYQGGAHPYSEQEVYTFRAGTGERLSLTQAAADSPEEIRQFMLSYLSGLNEGEYSGLIDLDFFRGYEADDYAFFVENDTLQVCFDRYEGVAYFVGELPSVELPGGLKEELR